MELRKWRYLVTFRVAALGNVGLTRQLIPSLIMDGYSARLIGAQLRISHRTVKTTCVACICELEFKRETRKRK